MCIITACVYVPECDTDTSEQNLKGNVSAMLIEVRGDLFIVYDIISLLT